MELSQYHRTYSQRSDEEIRRRAAVKELELSRIVAALKFVPGARTAHIAVLGSGDKRLIGFHKSMFRSAFGREVQLVTFDISTDHLAGAEGVVQHDVTTPLPNKPYDVTYSHILLRFIDTERQWSVLKHSYDALRAPGIAIHVIDSGDIGDRGRDADGFYSVPLERWKKGLAKDRVQFKEIPLKIEGILPNPVTSVALVLIK